MFLAKPAQLTFRVFAVRARPCPAALSCEMDNSTALAWADLLTGKLRRCANGMCVLVRVHGVHAVCISKLGKREILKRILLQRLRRRAICNAADKSHQSKRFEWEWPLCRERGGARYYCNGGT